MSIDKTSRALAAEPPVVGGRAHELQARCPGSCFFDDSQSFWTLAR